MTEERSLTGSKIFSLPKSDKEDDLAFISCVEVHPKTDVLYLVVTLFYLVYSHFFVRVSNFFGDFSSLGSKSAS